MKMKRIFGLIATGVLGLASLVWAGALEKETVAGISLGNGLVKVVGKFGLPEKKTASKDVEAATGCRYITYEYKSKGIDFVMCAADGNQSMGVNDIRVYGKSKAKTGKGIGIGSTRAEVEQAYGVLTQLFTDYDLGLMDEDSWCAINFKLKDGRVSEIMFGSSGLPE